MSSPSIQQFRCEAPACDGRHCAARNYISITPPVLTNKDVKRLRGAAKRIKALGARFHTQIHEWRDAYERSCAEDEARRQYEADVAEYCATMAHRRRVQTWREYARKLDMTPEQFGKHHLGYQCWVECC